MLVAGCVVVLTMSSLGAFAGPVTANTNIELIQDGGFETVPGPWQQFSQGGYTVLQPINPHTGSNAFFACAHLSCDDRVWQTIQVPSTVNAARLMFWLDADTSLPGGNACLDHFSVTLATLDGTVFDSVLASCASSTNGYALQLFDVTSALQAHANQQVALLFRGTTANVAGSPHFFSEWFVDDVSLTVESTSTLVFDDEFQGTSLDTRKWIALNRPGDSSNSEQQCYLPSNAQVANGALTLTDRADTSCAGYQYTSAMVQTNSFTFTYGTFEVRARMPSGAGQWPALWLLGANCQATNPTTADNTGACQWPTPGSNEIDLFEGKNTQTTTGFFNLHTGTSPNLDDQAFGCNDVSLSIDTSAGYHTYDLIWQPGSLTWQIDGQTYCSTTANVPSTAMFILLNVAVGGTFTGLQVDTSVMPQTLSVAYVRVYQ
jgi:beta-glucanase (GH16 family)